VDHRGSAGGEVGEVGDGLCQGVAYGGRVAVWWSVGECSSVGVVTGQQSVQYYDAPVVFAETFVCVFFYPLILFRYCDFDSCLRLRSL